MFGRPPLAVLRTDLAINFYADESSQNGHRFLVLGALSARVNSITEIVREFSELRQEHNLSSEMKWTKVTNQKFHVYREWVETFFKFTTTRQVRFQALVLDTSTFDHKTYNAGDGEIGFNKMLYQLLLHRIGKRYGGDSPIYGYLDSRTTRHTPEALQKMLNATLARDHKIKTSPFRRMIFRDSCDCDLIQTVDILCGAIAFERNGHGLKADARQSKKDLAALILSESTRKPVKWQFNIWDFEFKNRVPQA